MWPLSRAWYGDRLAPGYRPKSTEQLQRILTDLGLVSDFWQL